MKTESYSELLELIELAEKVSDKTEFYKNKLFNLRLQVLVFTLSSFGIFALLAYIANDYDLKKDNTQFAILFFCFIASLIYIFVLFRQIYRFRKYYYHERKTLVRLLEMTNEFKLLSFESPTLSVIEKAMVEMRLSRINFNE